MTSIRKTSGFSLLEVLIAMLIFSFGLMGLAALQSFSVKNNQSSSFRSQATSLAYMIIDNMRANRPAVLNHLYYSPNYTTVACQAADPVGATTAATDMAVWRNNIACALPGGKGAIQFPGPENQVTILITWDDARWAIDPAARDTEFRLDSTL